MVPFLFCIFFLFCSLDIPFATMLTLCDFGVGNRKLCYNFLKNKKKKEKFFQNKNQKDFIILCD